MDDLDEIEALNAMIGVARLHSGQNDRIDAMLGRIQNELVDLTDPAWGVVPSQIDRLKAEIDWMNESLKPLDGRIAPGGAPFAAHLHFASTVARRAGRDAAPEARPYLERLAEHLFAAARRANANGANDVKWVPGGTR